MMSEREKFVLKGGIRSDVNHKTFTRTIKRQSSCQLQLGHQPPHTHSKGQGGRAKEKRFPLSYNLIRPPGVMLEIVCVHICSLLEGTAQSFSVYQ